MTNKLQKKLYIHIGYPKTATSTIQHTLHRNRKLLQQYDFYYPTSGIIGVGKHSLAVAVQAKRPASKHDPEIKSLIDEIHHCSYNTVILTNERFASFRADEIADLKTICEDFDTYIVVYIRRQDLLLQSLWSQRAKSGNQTLAFHDWVNTFLQHLDEFHEGSDVALKLSRFSPDYRYVLHLWSEVFGTDHILVRPFERSQLNPNVVADFLDTCGMAETAWLPEAPRLNVTPSIKTVEVLRQLGAKWKLHLARDNNLERTYNKAYAIMQDQADKLGWNDAKLNLITPELHEHIMSIFEEGNTEVAHTYLRRDYLFTEPFNEAMTSTFKLDQVSGAEIIDLVQPVLPLMFERAYYNSRGNGRLWVTLAKFGYDLLKRQLKR